MPTLPLWLLLLLALPTAGCCSLSRLFCGPDRSPWISVRFDTPEQAVATLLEAIRRDDAEVVYLCLADSYRRRLGIDSLVAQVAWQQVRDQNPGLHLAGYATIPAAEALGDGSARFVLDVEGTKVTVEVTEEWIWQVDYRRPDGSLGEHGGRVSSWRGLARVEPVPDADTERSRLRLEPLPFEHEGIDAIPLDRIVAAGLRRRWRIADLKVAQD